MGSSSHEFATSSGGSASKQVPGATQPRGGETPDGLRRSKGSGGEGIRILHVTPELSSLPAEFARIQPNITAKAGGLADVTAALFEGFHRMGSDVHVTLPHYRRLFGVDPNHFDPSSWREYRRKNGLETVHLAEDRSFYYREKLYDEATNLDIALAFQREVINNVIPRVDPDLVHCHDWMTGLVPAAARRLGIPSVFTIHNTHTERLTLECIESHGIDAAEFWSSLYFENYPTHCESTRQHNRVDLLASGIIGSDFVTTVSPTFMDELSQGSQGSLAHPLRAHLEWRCSCGAARGILNAPHRSYDPSIDPSLVRCFDATTATEGKAINKAAFQEMTGLAVDPDAALYFWPSRLDPVQKGCQLLAEILGQLTADQMGSRIQLAIVADGPFQKHFHEIVSMHGLHGQVAIRDFNEDLSRLGYAAADFALVPSRYEPCGLAQMIALRYGTLPVAHRTGGLRDTVRQLQGSDIGNGFLFENYDSNGLRWAISESIRFHGLAKPEKARVVSRVMKEAGLAFSPEQMMLEYSDVYQGTAGQVSGWTVSP